MNDPVESLIRLRMSTADGHYGGGLVDGARMAALFGNAVTELFIRNDGDEGLMRVMKSSRKFECTAHKVIAAVDLEESAAGLLPEPIQVVRATGVPVVPVAR